MMLTAIIEKGENGWLVGQLEEIPAVMSQGKTIDELKGNLLDALNLYTEANNGDTIFYSEPRPILLNFYTAGDSPSGA